MNEAPQRQRHTVTTGRWSRRKSLQSDLAVCAWIPLFALRCEERRRPELVLRPTGLLTPDDNRRLWQVSARARHLGVKPGITVSQAVGLCPSITLCEPDPVYYDEQFARLLAALEHVSPVIEPAELGRAYVGVDGLETLYGPPGNQVEVIERAMTEAWQRDGAAGASARDCPTQDHRSVIRLGWGRGKFTAWVAATQTKPGETVIVPDAERRAFLASQPLGVLRIDPDTHRRLLQIGLKTLGDLARLPQAAVISQFGREGRRIWQLATGAVVDPVVGRIRPEPIVTEIDFPSPVADAAMLAHALERLIERALRHPRRIGWRVLTARARGVQEHGTSWMIQVTLKDPSADAGHIAAPLRSRLDQAPPTGALDSLAVEFTDFVRGVGELQLFARDASSAARAGRQRALRTAVREIKTRFRRSGLFHVVEVHPWSRIPERRYALIDYEP